MKSITHSDMAVTVGGGRSPILVIAGCTLLAAAAGGAAMSSGGILAFVGIAALSQAGCVAIEMPW